MTTGVVQGPSSYWSAPHSPFSLLSCSRGLNNLVEFVVELGVEFDGPSKAKIDAYLTAAEIRALNEDEDF